MGAAQATGGRAPEERGVSLAHLADDHARGCHALHRVTGALRELGVTGVVPQLMLALYRASRCGGALTVKSWEAVTGLSNASYLTDRAAELGLVEKRMSDNDRRTYVVTLTGNALALVARLEHKLEGHAQELEPPGEPVGIGMTDKWG